MQLDKNKKYNITFDTNVFDRLSKNSNFFNSFSKNFPERDSRNFNYIITPAMFLEYVGVNLKNINKKNIFKDEILNSEELNAHREELHDLYRNKEIEIEIRNGTRQLREIKEWQKYINKTEIAALHILDMAKKVYSEMEELQVEQLRLMFKMKERECRTGFKPNFDSIFKRFWSDEDYLCGYIYESLQMDFLCRYIHEIINRKIVPVRNGNEGFAEYYINKAISETMLWRLFKIYKKRRNVSFTRVFIQMAQTLRREGCRNDSDFESKLSPVDEMYFRSAEGIKARRDLLDLDLVHFSYTGVFCKTGEMIPSIAVLGEENNNTNERENTYKRIKDFHLSAQHYNQNPPSSLEICKNSMSLENHGYFLFFDLGTGEITHEIDVKNVISESNL